MGVLFSRLVAVPLAPEVAAAPKAVVITGCDTGFGHMLALRLSRLGHPVVAGCLTAKGLETLSDAARAQQIPVFSDVSGDMPTTAVAVDLVRKGALFLVMLDVCKTDDIDRLKATVDTWFPCGLHALVNNAGIAQAGFVEWLSMDAYRRVMEVNFFGLVAMTRALLPAIRKRRGRVVNVASMFGRVATQSVSAYCASKYAVEAFSDSLRREMWPFGVQVALIEPGFAKTPINHNTYDLALRNYESANDEVKAAYGSQFAGGMRGAVDEIMDRAMEPDVVVDMMVDAVDAEAPSTRYLIGKDAWLYATLNAVPTVIADWFAARFTPMWSVLPTQAIFKRA